MRLQDLIKALWLSLLYKFSLMDSEKIIAGMLKWLTGVPEKRVNDLSSEVFLKKHYQKITDEARIEIMWHQDRNAATVILSSALYPVCQAVAGHLNIDDVICTSSKLSTAYVPAKPAGKPCFGKEKATRLKEYCEKNNSKVETPGIMVIPSLTFLY